MDLIEQYKQKYGVKTLGQGITNNFQPVNHPITPMQYVNNY